MDISFDAPSTSTRTGSFFVPPPPEDGPAFDPFLFQSQLTQSQSTRVPHSIAASSKVKQSSSFGTFQFEEQVADYDHNAFSGGRGLQKVPGTPTQLELGTALPSTEDYRLNYDMPSGPGGRPDVQLRSVMEVPERYRSVFSFPYFNIMQSKVFDEVMYSDHPLVVSAPTGSGKTAVFELAIVRVLMQLGEHAASNIKMVYVAPIKALCSEKCEEWRAKFGPLGLECIELTGDSEMDDFFELQKANIITTTPEKWDSMTRRWRDNKALVQLVRLFLIDEVHQLNDPTRGATVEAVVSRMKTVQSSLPATQHHTQGPAPTAGIRFLAISATIPNITDVAAWLGSEEEPATAFNIDESHRPVHLRKVVLGYPDSTSDFKFDLSLNYRLSTIIHTYSDDKPSLVFCATRKGTQQAAATLVKDARFVVNVQHKQKLFQVANSLRDSKLRDLLIYGVGYHHAGLDMADRKTVEAVFISGELPVLFCTSTLAMGVNLPAHLVVIKSTMQYVNSGFAEYGESQVLQMIGRAGRPQFDTSATAVIMTKNATKSKYDALINGSQVIESSLHTNLIEHLNAEVVLRAITDVSVALQWLKSTFLFVRIKQNPRHYGIPEHLDPSRLEEKLQDMCLKNLHLLEAHCLISMVDGFEVKPTEKGRLMAQYCVAFESAKKFLSIKGTESVGELVSVLSVCPELSDVRLRVNERRTLNALNSDKNRQTIRYPMSGKIKTTDMKVNCLIQATLGCLPVQDFSLNQDTQKIFRAVTRLSKCLMEYQFQESSYQSLLSAVLCSKCLKARIWENSKHVAKQLDKIGVTLSTALVNAGITSFEAVLATNPRELEMILNKHPPFGNQLRESVSKLPSYHLTVVQANARQPKSSQAELTLTVTLTNHTHLQESSVHFRSNQGAILMVGDLGNRVVFKSKIMDTLLQNEGQVVKTVNVCRSPKGDELEVHLVHMDYVGVDQSCKFSPVYSTPSLPHGRVPVTSTPMHAGLKVEPPQARNNFSIGFEEYLDSDEEEGMGNGKHTQSSKAPVSRKQCNHRCNNKRTYHICCAPCGHECCKEGVVVEKKMAEKRPPRPLTGASKQQRLPQGDGMDSYLDQLHYKVKDIPQTPAIKHFKMSDPSPLSTSLEHKFGYKRDAKPKFTPHGQFAHTNASGGHPTPAYAPGGHPTPIYGPGEHPTPAYAPRGYSTPIYGPGEHPTPAYGPGGHPTPTYGPGGHPTPTYGPGGHSTPTYGPGEHPAPAYGPGGHPTPTYGPGGHPTPTYGPGGHSTPTYGPGGHPTPTYGPGGHPTPTYGPGGHSTPTYGPGGHPTPTYGPGGHTTPTYGPGGHPTPAYGPSSNPIKPVHQTLARGEPKGKGRAAAGCYDDSVSDAIDIDELFEGYESAEDSLVPELNFELEFASEVGSDSGLGLTTPISPQMPSPAGAINPPFNSSAYTLPFMRSAWEPSTSPHSYTAPKQRTTLPSLLQPSAHNARTNTFPLHPTNPIPQPLPRQQPHPLTPTMAKKNFTFRKQTSASLTQGCSSAATPTTSSALALNPAQAPMQQKLLQSLHDPSALLQSPTRCQKKATLQLRSLVPTFNTFNVGPPTASPGGRQGEPPATKKSGDRMDPSTGQHTGGKSREGTPTSEKPAASGLLRTEGRSGDTFVSFFTSGPGVRSAIDDSHGMDDVFDGIL